MLRKQITLLLSIGFLFVTLIFFDSCSSGGKRAGRVADVNNTEAAPGFNKARGPSGPVLSIAPTKDGSGKMYVAGYFKTYDSK